MVSLLAREPPSLLHAPEGTVNYASGIRSLKSAVKTLAAYGRVLRIEARSLSGEQVYERFECWAGYSPSPKQLKQIEADQSTLT